VEINALHVKVLVRHCRKSTIAAPHIKESSVAFPAQQQIQPFLIALCTGLAKLIPSHLVATDRGRLRTNQTPLAHLRPQNDANGSSPLLYSHPHWPG
jgi:hypothetical protein